MSGLKGAQHQRWRTFVVFPATLATMLFATSADSSYVWEPAFQATESDTVGGLASNITFSVDGSPFLHLIANEWFAATNARRGYYMEIQDDLTSSWSSAQPFTPTPDLGPDGHIATDINLMVDATDQLHVVYEGHGGSFYPEKSTLYYKRNGNPTLWDSTEVPIPVTPPQQPESPPCRLLSPRVHLDSSGIMHVIGRKTNNSFVCIAADTLGTNGMFYTQKDVSSAEDEWLDPTRVTERFWPNAGAGATVAADDSGTVHFVGTEEDATEYVVLHASGTPLNRPGNPGGSIL